MKLTPTEQRIYDLLLDGALHNKKEVADTCLEDKLGDASNIQVHISNLRKKIPPGFLILFNTPNCRAGGGYRLVRHINPSNTGRV